MTVPADSLNVQCTQQAGEIAIVADNSGSERGFLSQLKQASRDVVDGIVPGGGKASLVRVTTNSEVKVQLTDSLTDLHSGIDGMFIHKGWTSLYDGIRMGNETLGGDVRTRLSSPRFADAEKFCIASRRLGLMVFTDGRDNNSGGEKLMSEEYPGDGINTTMEDLYSLKVDGLTTPIYTVGLGADVDHDLLANLAKHNGGRHLPIQTSDDLPQVFGMIKDYFGASHQICGDLPKTECGWVDVRVQYQWQDGDKTAEGEKIDHLYIPCPPPREQGRSATVLLTLSNPYISEDAAAQLIYQTVDWVAPVSDPKVLVMFDDNNHNEFPADAQYVFELLKKRKYNVTYKEEPKGGLKTKDLQGYEVVWFANPGYPINDESTVDALKAFLADGGAVVLQGDDMAWFWGRDFSMAPLTHLNFVDNGTSYCGVNIDNNNGNVYEVTLNTNDQHPIVAALEGMTFNYGDDIDTTTPRGEGEHVLAWARVAGREDCPLKPAIVAYDPQD